MNDVIKYKPIGYVRNEHSDEVVRTSWRGVKARIEVLPDYVEGFELRLLTSLIYLDWLI